MEDRVAKLVLKAVRTLPQRDQDQVLTALFRSALSEPTPAEPNPSAQPTPPPEVLMLSHQGAFPVPAPTMGASGQSTMLPVRLPPDLHERLRRWSTDQGFSMAGVVRGLVERFLDQQSGTKPRKRPVASKPKPKRTTARG